MLILCYHALSPTWTAELSVTPDHFERQMAALLGRGWRAVTFSEATLNPTAGRAVAITFDDAFASVKRYAAPILARYDAPATVFAPTAYLHGAPLAWPGVEHWLKTPSSSELAAMSWDDLGQLAEDGWEIGSHTHTHPHLRALDDASLTAELETPRQLLSDRLARTCRSIAYPYGDVDDRVAVRARDAGYVAGAAMGRSLRDLGPHRVPRIGVYHGDARGRFALKISRSTRSIRTRLR